MLNTRFLLFALIGLSLITTAQSITEIRVGVNGLTCSACTRSVEMSLLRLNFIDSVQMSLENTEGIVFTKALLPLDFNRIAQAVKDAGFSVRFLQATFSLQRITLTDNGCFQIGGNTFQWVEPHPSEGRVMVTFVDAPFVPGNQYSKWKKKFAPQSCAGQPVFHITHESL